MESQLTVTEAKKKKKKGDVLALVSEISVEAFAQLDPVVHMTAKLLVSHLLLFQTGFSLCPAGRLLPHRQGRVAGRGPVFSILDF